MKSMSVALQLYSLREEAEKDFVGVLEETKAMGYAGVEFAGFYGLPAEQVGKARVERFRPAIAVIGGIELVGGGDGRENLGADRSGIVGKEAHVRAMRGRARRVNCRRSR